MTEQELQTLKYPIGTFTKPETINGKQIQNWIVDIERFPDDIEQTTKDLKPQQLNWNYRPNGWNIKQVVHHCADSHMNALIRIKLALTEESPTIKPYYEDRWAKLIDDNDDDLKDSMMILKGVHAKLAKLLNCLSQDDLNRNYIHPEHNKRFQLDEVIGLYAWHSNHHMAHIKQALKFNGKF